ncbi:MAG: MBL fold metallo-hydrolase [Spirochaetota bacterium]|nr:MAG: MBL fold metallo-hydrolase [Spirochaetota bacterium]
MKVIFWGVRGSIPTPGPQTVKYGGNTTCFEVRLNDGRVIVIGAGSGVRALGNKLVMEDMKKGPLNLNLFVSHTHWDHIMGFPFFTPIYIPGNKIRVHGPVNIGDESLESVFAIQMSYNYFPMRADELSADITYEILKEGTFQLYDDVKITTKILNHPVIDLGYRIEADGVVFVTAYDHEPFRNLFDGNPEDEDYDEVAKIEGEKAAKINNLKIQQFIHGADLLIHDAQYTNKEYLASKIGWGHSPIEYVLHSTIKAKVKRLALHHHDPTRPDTELDLIERIAKKRVAQIKHTDMEVFVAKEGLEVEL